MSDSRIIYQNWIVELGHDPDIPVYMSGKSPNDSGIAEKVRSAMNSLTDEEQEFIARFYFMGQTYQDLSEATGRAEHKLSSLHKRCIRKIRRLLADYVRSEFGLSSGGIGTCALCVSEHLKEINKLIRNRDRTATWRGVMRELNERFGIRVRTPQLLIGHERYHMAVNQRQEAA
ncbi:MAG TPA: sigma factor-like helix-turn-helix DNA-binding protein [candidate division Zixibacteria bacterium]|nr:sigma factor-like helix-turn-helix DNA-binding protein [candidate division Zixibacteria bacterium]